MVKLYFLIGLICYLTPLSANEIGLHYSLTRQENQPKIIAAQLTLTNLTDKSIYFLSETCNGLSYYVTPSTPKASPYILVHCNASFPEKVALAPKGTFQFRMLFSTTESLSELALNVTLFLLKETTPVKGRPIEEVRTKDAYKVLALQGPVVKIG